MSLASLPSSQPAQRSGAGILAAFVAVALLFAIALAMGRFDTRPPFGIPERTAWTTSRVSGSPEPPLPFETQRAFPKLTFDRPLDIAFAPGSNRVFVAQQKGTLLSFPNDPNVTHADVLFDRSELLHLENIPDCKGAGDTLAITFHPQFQKNHYCYIQYNLNYTTYQRNRENGSRISRFTVTDSDPPRFDPKSELIVLQWTSGGHNGCALKFGPDGFLYISTGDGADPNPPDIHNTGQDISDLLSSILRIDVDHPGPDKPYSIPPDNPFVSTAGARPEVYAYGLRNPFRMNFDSKAGNLWVGDVGWELWESIVCVKPAGNYGWSIMEGPNPVHPNGKRGPTEISKPQAALFHTEAASITGGLVYRGTKMPELFGHYIFGDWQTCTLWAAKCVGAKEDALEPYRTIAQTDQRIVAFGEDPDHEPIIVDHGGGGLYRLVPNPAVGQPPAFPRKLSETGLFTALKEQVPAAGVLPFNVNAPQWVDGAEAKRFVAVPGTGRMFWGKGVWGDDKPTWPKESVLVRTLALETHAGDAASKKNIETQLLHFDGRQWHGYSFAWKDDQSDAELVPAGGDERTVDIVDPAAPGGSRRQTWHYPSRTQCMTCHNVWCDYTLGFNVQQLDRTERYPAAAGGTVIDNPVRSYRHIGLLIEPKPSNWVWFDAKRATNPNPERSTLTNPYDTSADLHERARSYLHVNCSHCHRFGGGGTALFDVRKDLHTSELKAVNQRALLGDFGIDGAKLICPADPNRSIFLYRTSKLGRGRMPHIGSDMVDEKGTLLLRQWIAGIEAPASSDEAALLSARAQEQGDLKALASAEAAEAALDRLLATTTGAQALLGEVQTGKLPDSVLKMALAKAIASPQENVRDLFRRFDPREQFIVRLGPTFDRSKLLAMPGDAARGKKIFEAASGAEPAAGTGANPGAAPASSGACINCHRVNGQGKDFGPDLSHVATKYKKEQLLENIVEPSKTIAEGFANYLLKKTSGELVTGLLVSKSETEVILKDQEKQIHVPADEVQKLTPQTISVMPEGLLANLSPQEAADLLEYLASLK